MASHFDIDDSELTRKHGISSHFLKYVCAILAAMGAVAAYLSVSHEITLSVHGEGRIEPVRTHSIRAEVAGVLRNLYCKESDLVAKGQLLAEVHNRQWDREIARIAEEIRINDSRKRELRLKIDQERGEHRLTTDIAALELEELLVRRDRLLAEHLIYTESASSMKRKPLEQLFPVKSIQAAIRGKEAQLDLARRRYGKIAMYEQEVLTVERIQNKHRKEVALIERERAKGAVRSSVPGIVVGQDLHRQVGKYVTAGEEILQIAGTGGWQGRIFVSERDQPKVMEGLSAQVYVQAFPHTDYRIFSGTVKRLGQKPVEHPVQGVVYPVYIGIPDPRIIAQGDTLSLADGMSIDARIVVAEGTIHQILRKRLLESTGALDKANPLSALLLN